MLVFFWIAVLLLVAAGFLYLKSQERRPSRPQPETLRPRTLFNLQIGDIVQYAGEDWAVEGRLVYDEGGYTWLEYLLQIDDRIAWLCVDEDDRLVTSLLEPTRELKFAADPPAELDFAGDRYCCIESGQARMTRTGASGRPQAESCRYWDYEGPEDKVLSVEDWQGSWEVTVGHTVSPRALNLLPGDGESIYRPRD